MKLNKVAIGAMSLGLVGLANVQGQNGSGGTFTVPGGTPVIHITGSTANRGHTFNAIVNALGGPGGTNVHIGAWNCAIPIAVPSGYSQAQTASFMAIYGTNPISGNAVLVKAHWSGTEAGYIDAATPSQVESFTANGELLGSFGNPVLSTNAPPLPTVGESGIDLAMADNRPSSAKPPVNTNAAALAANFKVGVTPFVYVKNAQFASNNVAPYTEWTNITKAQLQILIKTGAMKLAQLADDPTVTNWVYLCGRDNNSGTRVVSLLNSYILPTQALKQTKITGSEPNPVINPLSSAPTAGQSSGAALANSMTIRGSANTADPINGGTGWYAVAHLGLADATGANQFNTAGGGTSMILSLDGVPESTQAIQQGTYSFWSYEYISLSNGAGPEGVNLYNYLTGTNTTTTAFDIGITPGLEISLGSMQCTSPGDGGNPVHN
jgi:hypothetical protein